MKKRNFVIASLLVLSLCFVFFGCGEKEEGEKDLSVVPDAVKAAVRQLGYTGTFLTPAGTTYTGYYADSETDATWLTVWWADGDQEKFEDYKAAWVAKGLSISTRRLDFGDNVYSLTGFGDADISVIGFIAAEATDSDGTHSYTVPSNSIVFKAYKY